MQHTHALFSRLLPNEKRITMHFMYPDSTVHPIVYPPYEVGAAGGVWSTAEDISKWMLFMLDSTKVAGKPLLKPETYAALLRPQVIGEPYPTAAVVHHHWDTYGLGWFQHDYKGRMLQYHKGSLVVKDSEPGKGTTFRIVLKK
jgi:CubicO group peptidase (beta-lactamase class C family)